MVVAAYQCRVPLGGNGPSERTNRTPPSARGIGIHKSSISLWPFFAKSAVLVDFDEMECHWRFESTGTETIDR